MREVITSFLSFLLKAMRRQEVALSRSSLKNVALRGLRVKGLSIGCMIGVRTLLW